MFFFLFGCHDAKPGDTESIPTELIGADGGRIGVGADGALLFTDAAGQQRSLSISLGQVPSYDDGFNYDPWNLTTDAAPTSLAWSAATAATLDGDTFTLTLANGDLVTVTVDTTGPGLRLTLGQTVSAPYIRLQLGVADDEEFYGLGEWFDGARHRGHVHAMQIELDSTLESAYNEAHVPVPLLISSAGYGLFVDSYRPGVFDVAASEPDTVTVTYNDPSGLVLDLYASGQPTAVVAAYHQRTGMPEVPPTWAFAPLQWRNVAATSDVVRQDAEAIRSYGVATGLIWVDNPWQTTYNSMVPDPEMFPDWDALVGELHAAGFRTMAWSTPYVEDVDPDYVTYEANGWFVDAPILFSDFGEMVDLTHPDAMAAWQARVATAAGRGIEGWKLDYGEDVQLGIGSARLPYLFANGEDERTMHHQYQLFYHTAYTAPYDGDGFVLGRAGVHGAHTITDCIWPGDLDSDFRVFGEDGHVGGLPSAIRGGTGLAASGYPFFASDTGGYRHDRPTHEVMVRWTEYSALLPIMQYGGGGENHNPWDFTAYGESQFTEETLSIFIRYASLHTRLFPYFWALAEQTAATGAPIVVAQGMAWPEAGVHTDDTFMVGPDLFVAPVETEGATTKDVVLPPGEWVHWWTGETYSGAVTVAAPLGQGPLFQRAGSAIPLLRPTVVTLSPSDGSVDSWADDPGRLYARVIPGEAGGFALSTGEALDITAAGLTLTDGTMYIGWNLEIYQPDGVTSVTLDGAPLPEGAEGCTDCWIPGDPYIQVIVASAGEVGVE